MQDIARLVAWHVIIAAKCNLGIIIENLLGTLSDEQKKIILQSINISFLP